MHYLKLAQKLQETCRVLCTALLPVGVSIGGRSRCHPGVGRAGDVWEWEAVGIPTLTLSLTRHDSLSVESLRDHLASKLDTVQTHTIASVWVRVWHGNYNRILISGTVRAGCAVSFFSL